MHIALFGGAFDPPHLGHLQVARSLLDQQLADAVWCVPTQDHPFDKQMSPSSNRVSMLQLVMRDSMRIERYEIEKTGKSYTFDTLAFFTKTYPSDQFSWVIGSDNVATFDRWFRYQDILQTHRVFVYPRAGSQETPLLHGMEWIPDVAPISVSSTQVRALVKSGKSLVGLVDSSVEEFIREHGLYKGDSGE